MGEESEGGSGVDRARWRCSKRKREEEQHRSTTKRQGQGERLERLWEKPEELKRKDAGKDSAVRRVCFERKINGHESRSSAADIIG